MGVFWPYNGLGVSDASVAGLSQALGVEPSQAGSLIQQQRCPLLNIVKKGGKYTDHVTINICFSGKVEEKLERTVHSPHHPLILTASQSYTYTTAESRAEPMRPSLISPEWIWTWQCCHPESHHCHHSGIIATKPVFAVSNKKRFKPVSSATDTSYKCVILRVASLDMILSNTWITKALIRLCECSGWSAPLLFTNHALRPILALASWKSHSL